MIYSLTLNKYSLNKIRKTWSATWLVQDLGATDAKLRFDLIKVEDSRSRNTWVNYLLGYSYKIVSTLSQEHIVALISYLLYYTTHLYVNYYILYISRHDNIIIHMLYKKYIFSIISISILLDPKPNNELWIMDSGNDPKH